VTGAAGTTTAVRGRMEGQVPYSVCRVGDAWVIFSDGQPILAMKNRRDANRCAGRAAQLLAEWQARAGDTTAEPDDSSGRGDGGH